MLWSIMWPRWAARRNGYPNTPHAVNSGMPIGMMRSHPEKIAGTRRGSASPSAMDAARHGRTIVST
jgi:hypothetical protein